MMSIEKKTRIQFIDSLKGFAIFLVVWGHSIQYVWSNYSFYDDKVFEFIYSFHMSLFFFISGFFSDSSLKLDAKSFFLKKSTQLILPCLTWGAILTILKILFLVWHNEWMPDIPQYFYSTSIHNPALWFLPVIFACSAIMYLINKITKNFLLLFALSVIVSMFIPDNDYIRGYMIRTFLPMFLLGFAFKYLYDTMQKKALLYLIAFGVFFVVLLYFWKPIYTVYLTHTPSIFHWNIEAYKISIFRIVVGLAGSLFFFFLFKCIYTKNKYFGVLSYVGKYTLEIYIIQAIFLRKIVESISIFQNVNLIVYDFVVTPGISIIFISISLILIKIISKSRYLNKFFLGKADA